MWVTAQHFIFNKHTHQASHSSPLYSSLFSFGVSLPLLMDPDVGLSSERNRGELKQIERLVEMIVDYDHFRDRNRRIRKHPSLGTKRLMESAGQLPPSPVELDFCGYSKWFSVFYHDWVLESFLVRYLVVTYCWSGRFGTWNMVQLFSDD